jgi:hypothetical protein
VALTVLTDDDLAAARNWRHAISADGGATLTLELADGRKLESASVSGVLNRLATVPWSWLSRVGGPDVRYAAQEMHALYLSWLHALPGPMLNRPTPQGLCGNNRRLSAWAAMAARAGLPIRPLKLTSEDDPDETWRAPQEGISRTVVVVRDRAIGPDDLATEHGAACARLASASGCALLGVEFGPTDDGWRVIGATPSPYLIDGGDRLADALAGALGA